jgi:PEP-CTERM/exosortase A-associated glycosyltransferase
MRILHILDHSLPLQSGYSLRTVAILREQRRLGWETLQLTTPRHGRAPQEVDEVDGWQFHRTPLAANGRSALPVLLYAQEMRATAHRVVELARQFRPDILHAHSPVLNALPAIRAARSCGLPVVYEVRALWEDAAVDHGVTLEGSTRYRLSRALETFALRRVDRVTTICDGLRTEIAARGVPMDRITVVPNAVDPSRFQVGGVRDEALCARLGLKDRMVVGFVGSFYAYEGLDLLIEAMAMLSRRYPKLRALLVGDGPQAANLRAMARERDLADRIVFTGSVAHGEVPRYYDLIDVLAYPRHRMRLTEIVTPLKPLEAMAQGRVLVASNVGGHRELIRDGETGIMFPAGDARALASALEALLERRNEWPRIRDAARHFVESERTWARSVGQYAVVYETLTRARAQCGAGGARVGGAGGDPVEAEQAGKG